MPKLNLKKLNVRPRNNGWDINTKHWVPFPTWAMSCVSCICESELGPDGGRGGESGPEHFGGSHQFSPVMYGILPG